MVILIHENAEEVTCTGKHCLFVFLNSSSDKSNGSSLSQTARGVKSYNYLHGTVSKQFSHRDMFLCLVLSGKAVGNA